MLKLTGGAIGRSTEDKQRPVAKYTSQPDVSTPTRPLFLERHESHECGDYKGGALVENTRVLHVSVACPEALPNARGLQYR